MSYFYRMITKIRLVLSLLTVGILLSTCSFGWGRKGHTIVSQIALTMIDSSTRAIVLNDLDQMTPEQAGNWMDDKRSDHNYDYMKPWHYVNIEPGSVYAPGKEPDVVSALDSSIAKLEHLANLSHEEIKKNLLIIFHLVGDMHQPLHVGYASDKGGNTIQVKYLTKDANLHRVWDTEIIEGENITENDCLMRLQGFDKDRIKSLSVINPEKWITEPRSKLSGVYKFQDNTIDRTYIDRNIPVIEDQLLVAGIRLAAVLNHLFKA